MQARFYLPQYGRFGSPDPALDQHFELTQSWNIYSYVRNMPTIQVDPTGMLAATPAESTTPTDSAGGAANTTPPPNTGAGDLNPATKIDKKSEAQTGDDGKKKVPAPTDADGKATPPPVKVPGAPDSDWKWYPDKQNPRGGTWGPKGWKGPNPPKGSWDPDGHWDIDPGKGEPREHYDPSGKPLTPEQVHPGAKPANSSFVDFLKSIPPQKVRDAGTAAIVIYLIISEGSRVIPARNLVPVP